jgi:hypothetical protein
VQNLTGALEALAIKHLRLGTVAFQATAESWASEAR